MIRSLKYTFILGAALIAAACAAINPIGQAVTVEQKALAAYGSVTIVIEQIAAVLEPDTLPDSVQRVLVNAAERGGAVAKAGLVAYDQAQQARADFAAGRATEGALLTAVSSLESWIKDADQTAGDLQAALRGAR